MTGHFSDIKGRQKCFPFLVVCGSLFAAVMNNLLANMKYFQLANGRRKRTLVTKTSVRRTELYN